MTSDEIRKYTFDMNDVTQHNDAQTLTLAAIFKMTREIAVHVAQINERQQGKDNQL